ncbi:MAG: branched-chain amino acid ABC transporter permease [Deltaproteobacteria bacterium]|nr:branched-chain amino acid ABC transporter permease [Deltaproteobacteria bacterium]MBW1959098.1 branched-chain amino acid ABC transporter permease [Deltaproteobacteria bacterium]MBW2013804.1 branched-chain amino acid ABC transporter permease [Deltaproteobacteria bacterium]MBW2087422.1 branched-chain amino acid ABC transporter permease [Deltaproteobacteria bacterium]MBW2319865.1 branched-chain amino acid ABC transporter permease [Deltaproteobacteria bacterium]
MNNLIKQKDILGFGALAVIIIVLPLFVESKYYFIVLNVIGLNTIVVVGLNLLIGFAGQISLGHAAFYGLGSYFSGILTVNYGFPLWPAMVVGMMATGAVAYLIGYPSLKLRGHYLVMATLGFGIIINILMGELEQFTGGHDGLMGIPPLAIGGWVFDNDLKNFYLIWSFVFLCMVAARNLLNSRVGRALRAISGSEVAANSLGVNTADYKVKIFVLSAMFASISGSLYAHYITFISPSSYDFHYSIQVVTMVIVGGMGSLWGSLLGAGVLTCISEALHIAKQYHIIAYGVFLCLVLVFLPEGVLMGITNFLVKNKDKAANYKNGLT